MITEPGEDFGAIWPELFTRVVATLRHRGVELTAAEDAAQEAGARALAGQVTYESPDDLYRWLLVVAWRVAIGAHRRSSRFSDDVIERAAPVDVAAEVEGRLRLRAVCQALPSMSAADRATLLAEPASTRTRQEAVKLAVRRHRARARLTALVDGAAVIFVGGWRRAWRALVPASTAAAAIALPLALVVPSETQPNDVSRESKGAAGRVHVVRLPADLLDASRNIYAPAHNLPHPASTPTKGPAAAPRLPDSLVAPIPSGNGDERGRVTVGPYERPTPLLCAESQRVGVVACTPEHEVIATSPVPPPLP